MKQFTTRRIILLLFSGLLIVLIVLVLVSSHMENPTMLNMLPKRMMFRYWLAYWKVSGPVPKILSIGSFMANPRPVINMATITISTKALPNTSSALFKSFRPRLMEIRTPAPIPMSIPKAIIISMKFGPR